MADKAISELTSATSFNTDDLLVLQQDGVVKNISGQAMTTWLTKLAQGKGGISKIEKTATTGLTDTYTITFADASTFDYTIDNGKSITSITQSTSGTSKNGQLHRYTYKYNDNTSQTFDVYDGLKGDTGDKGDKGDTGDASSIVSQSIQYGISSTGTDIPTSWYDTPISVDKGKYLWTKTVVNYNDGTTTTSYSNAYQGKDGAGAVITVNSKSPDDNGDVLLIASDIKTTDETTVEDAIASTLESAKSYADETVGESASVTLNTAKTYTDDQLSALTTYASFTAEIPTGEDTTTTVEVAGILASDNPIIDLQASASSDAIEAWGTVTSITTADGSITVASSDAISTAIPIKLLCVRK